MTDEIEDDVITEEAEEVTEESPPFLRITSCTPAAGDRIDTLTLDLHLRDDDPVGEYDRDRPGEREAAKSWVLDLVATTIHAMRGPSPASPTIMLAGRGVHAYLGDRIVHSPSCDGQCGLPTTTNADVDVTTLGHAGSDRRTGGDRKDER